jgi:hypothetical protein
MPETAKGMGLGSNIDERYNLEKSSKQLAILF